MGSRERLIGRRSIDSVGIKALIKQKTLEHGLAVEVHNAVFAIDLAHAEIALDAVVTHSQGIRDAVFSFQA